MDKLTDKQLASIDRSAKRVKGELGLFIKVATSRIYNGKPIHKAMLKEIIYLRMTDLHESDSRIPNGTPWKWKDYEGWCYAGQEYLAGRVGIHRVTANDVLKKIIEDGYLKTRKYRGKDGAWHKQYFPDEAFIDKKIAELGVITDDGTSDKSDGHHHEATDYKPKSSTATSPSSPRLQAHVAHDYKAMSSTATNPCSPRLQKGGTLGLSLKLGVSSTTASTTTSTTPAAQGHINKAAAPLVADAPKAKEKAKSTPTGLGVGKAEEEATAKPKAASASVPSYTPNFDEDFESVTERLRAK
jgi:hypothetical protein